MLAMKAVQPLFLAVDFFSSSSLYSDFRLVYLLVYALTAPCPHPLACFSLCACVCVMFGVVLVIWLLTMEIGDDAPVMMI